MIRLNYYQQDGVPLHAATTGGMVVLCTGDTFLLYYTNKLLIVWVSCCVCVGFVSHGSPPRQPGEGVRCHEPWASTISCFTHKRALKKLVGDV